MVFPPTTSHEVKALINEDEEAHEKPHEEATLRHSRDPNAGERLPHLCEDERTVQKGIEADRNGSERVKNGQETLGRRIKVPCAQSTATRRWKADRR